MSWYLKALKQYAVFSGRAQRMEYWMFFLFYNIFVFVTSFLDGFFFGVDPLAPEPFYLIFFLANYYYDYICVSLKLEDCLLICKLFYIQGRIQESFECTLCLHFDNCPYGRNKLPHE